MGSSISVRGAQESDHAAKSVHRILGSGTEADLPRFLVQFSRPGDSLSFLAGGRTEIVIERRSHRNRAVRLLYATIGHASLPKERKNGAGYVVRADLPKCSTGPQALFLSSDAIRRYFYLLDVRNSQQTLYNLLQTSDSVSLAELRVAWRVRSLEVEINRGAGFERSNLERAFNVLAHPDLRNCYDALCRDENVPPLFPYGGFGVILVEGQLSDDGEAFFGDRILAYKPEMISRRVSLLLRSCKFFSDRVVCRDTRRKLEVWLDANLIPSVPWDLTWNHWKHWLRTRLEVRATFVHADRYGLKSGEWIRRRWYAALPSRLRVNVPDDLAADIERAKAIHSLLGQHTNVVEKIRAEVKQRPIGHEVVQDWFDRLGVTTQLKPQHATWRPDYESTYFEQLRMRSRTWFLFRNEYLFVWTNVLISEIPQPGHATYVFSKPADVPAFMRRYSRVTREDIRRNRNNVATALGFIGRVIRGRKKKRWLNDVLKLAGEKTDYAEVFE